MITKRWAMEARLGIKTANTVVMALRKGKVAEANLLMGMMRNAPPIIRNAYTQRLFNIDARRKGWRVSR